MKEEKKKIDQLARACKKYLETRRKKSKATLKDLRVVALAQITGDFEPCKKLNLYNSYSGEYCESLSFFCEAVNRL